MIKAIAETTSKLEAKHKSDCLKQTEKHKVPLIIDVILINHRHYFTTILLFCPFTK
jgi:hypothetical protein